MNAEINTICHYFMDDPYCTGDFASLDVEIVLQGGIVFNEGTYNFSFGDAYHCRPFEQLDGMIVLLKAMGYKITENRINENDYIDY